MVDVIFNFPVFPLNILVTILVCKYFVGRILKKDDVYSNFELAKYIAFMALFYTSSMLLFEYGTVAILFALWGGICRQNKDRKRSIFLGIVCFAMFVLQELTFIPFNWYEATVMVIGTFIAIIVLQNFKVRHYEKYKNNAFGKVVMFFGRNTLYVYFINVSIFVMFSYFLFIDKHKEFSWF